MTDKQQQTTSRKACPERTSSACSQENLRNKTKCCRKSSTGYNSPKKMKNRRNQQRRTETYPYACCCAICNNTAACCTDDLEVIEEEQEPEVQYDEECEQQSCNRSAGVPTTPASTSAPTDEDPCGEFFDIMRETMEESVKKSIEDAFGRYFSKILQKLDNLSTQIERNECLMSKIYADVNDKISYYGERNAQQFQYLCVRMEHDRLFYQQQQEYFLKARSERYESQDENGSIDQQVQCPDDQESSPEEGCKKQLEQVQPTDNCNVNANANCKEDKQKKASKLAETQKEQDSESECLAICEDSFGEEEDKDLHCVRCSRMKVCKLDCNPKPPPLKKAKSTSQVTSGGKKSPRKK